MTTPTTVQLELSDAASVQQRWADLTVAVATNGCASTAQRRAFVNKLALIADPSLHYTLAQFHARVTEEARRVRDSAETTAWLVEHGVVEPAQPATRRLTLAWRVELEVELGTDSHWVIRAARGDVIYAPSAEAAVRNALLHPDLPQRLGVRAVHRASVTPLPARLVEP